MSQAATSRGERPFAIRLGQHKVLPEDARRYNRSLVLSTLFHEAPMSRADLARATGLTRVTISALVADLLVEQLVREMGVSDDVRPGKPATLIDIDEDHLCLVAIDLSGNEHFRAARLNLHGVVVEHCAVPIPQDLGDALGVIVDLAADMVARAPARVLGVGIGAPGIVNHDGVVLKASNLGWESVDLAGELRHATGVPVIVTNDANAAVLGEFTFADAAEDVLLIRVGRGVGSGLLVSGRVLDGAHLAGGELGHVTVGTDGGPLCGCGKLGCLEAWLSEPALTARLSTGHQDALRVAGERLGIALAPVVGVLDISEVLLSGPSELLDGELREAATETLESRILTRFHGVTVRMAGEGDDIVLRGAAVQVLSSQLGVF